MTLAERIRDASHLSGHFLLRSGQTSDSYFDKYRFESDPHLLRDIAEAMVPLIPPATDALAGVELGGVPIATALSLVCGMPARFVRKEPKTYGTRSLAEGGPVEGLRLTIVEDVITSGGQVLASVGDLRRLGASVEFALCVIDRDAGGAEELAAAGVRLTALFHASDLTGPGPATGPQETSVR